ncbi:MAG TPA: peptidase C39 family protein [Chthonomonadales bacterium]|nr:peptidase C39 family protein [Chthonomonadales bacterium]
MKDVLLQPAGGNRPPEPVLQDRRGRAFAAIQDSRDFDQKAGDNGEKILTSAPIPCPIATDEVVASWNLEAPPGTGLVVEALVNGDNSSEYAFCLGRWSPDNVLFKRGSVESQTSRAGTVHTDVLALSTTPGHIALRLSFLPSATGDYPQLKFLGISFAGTATQQAPLAPNREVWGTELTVPERSQLGWRGASGWCSPTSLCMALAFWSAALNRPELTLQVPDVAEHCYDHVFRGTGNWPFNTAFAGAFPGIRAYVCRFSDISELEDWIAAGIPVIVSVSYDLLKGGDDARDPGHLVVCVGFTNTGDIVVNDPAHRADLGEPGRRVFCRANFARAWAHSRQTVYLVYPESAKPPVDRFGHWAGGPKS